MVERIHEDDLVITEATVHALLSAQCSQWSGLELSYLRTSGTDNAMWRVPVPAGDDVVARLPRHARSIDNIVHEVDVLRSLEGGLLTNVVATPVVRHVGTPTAQFPYPWTVLGWLDGRDGWTARAALDGDADDLVRSLAEAIHLIGRLAQMPARRREPGERGGPIDPLLQRLDRWLDDPRWNAAGLIDVAAVRRAADDTREIADVPVATTFVHGDLIPGNILVAARRLTGIIDWSSAGYGDGALDLIPAWTMFDGRNRQVFREAMDADDASWLRARAFALEQAVGGVLYYTPRRHQLGEVMARTLRRILDEG